MEKRSSFIAFILLTILALNSCAPPHVLTAQEKAYASAMRAFPTEFSVPKDQSDEAWGRANRFLSKFSVLRLQMATDMLLTTYNPYKIGQYGYEITRMSGRENVTFNVECSSFTGNIFSDERHEANQNAHIAAYYIATGIVEPYFIYP